MSNRWREHYALTLRHWLKNLEANKARALDCVDEATYRVWRLYMASVGVWFQHQSRDNFSNIVSQAR